MSEIGGAAAMSGEQWENLVRRMITEWNNCECPFGQCPVYPHPVMLEAAEAAHWDAPEGVRPWSDRTEAWQKDKGSTSGKTVNPA